MEREVIRQKMPIKWNRDLKERWCQILSGRVSAVTLPVLAESARPGESVCKASHMQLIYSATVVNWKINCSIKKKIF